MINNLLDRLRAHTIPNTTTEWGSGRNAGVSVAIDTVQDYFSTSLSDESTYAFVAGLAMGAVHRIREMSRVPGNNVQIYEFASKAYDEILTALNKSPYRRDHDAASSRQHEAT